MNSLELFSPVTILDVTDHTYAPFTWGFSIIWLAFLKSDVGIGFDNSFFGEAFGACGHNNRDITQGQTNLTWTVNDSKLNQFAGTKKLSNEWRETEMEQDST